MRRVSLEAEWESIGGGSRENPGRKGSGENLAYVIYTSGSTGQPKGAMNTQAGIMNRLAWMQQEYGLESRDRVLQKTSFSFDVSVWELFWPLQTGAVLVMARPGGEQDVGYMKEVMEEEEISTVHFVPSMLEVFVGEWERGRCGNLRRVISSGEELKGGLVERFYAVERGNRGKLHNLYGPTETAVEVTFHECEEEGEGKRVAIGRPIGNLRMYVLDEWGGPAPIGVRGELYIGGVGVGRGYLKRAELTAERYVPDGFSPKGGERLYRTGRGYRIELGEIEAVLQEYEGVKQAAVMVREEESGDRQLVAYVVSEGAEGVEKEEQWSRELRGYLKGKLPEYMVPGGYVRMEELPLTPNGKLDRKRLPTLFAGETDEKSLSLAPRDGLEVRILQIWREVLGKQNISVKSDFFEVGGNSLRALVLVSRLRQLAEKPVPVRTAFKNRTIEQQAGFLRYETRWVAETSIVPLQDKGSLTPFFCVHPAGGLVNGYIDLAKHLGSDQPFYGIQAYGSEHGQPRFMSVVDMARQYIRDLKAQQPAGPYQLGGWSVGCVVAYEMAQQLTQAGDQVMLLALLDGAYNPNPIDFYEEGWEGAIDQWMQDYLIEHRELDLGEYGRQAGKSINRIPSPIQTSDFRRFLHTYATNVRAGLAYQMNPYPGKVTFFSAGNAMDDDWITNGWGRLALGGFELHMLPGTHNDFVYEPHVSFLAEELKTCMKQAAISVGLHPQVAKAASDKTVIAGARS